MPVARRGGGHDGPHAVERGVGGAGRATRFARVEHRGPALRHRRNKVRFEPVFVRDRRRRGLAIDLRVVKIREHRRTMIAPHTQIRDP